MWPLPGGVHRPGGFCSAQAPEGLPAGSSGGSACQPFSCCAAGPGGELAFQLPSLSLTHIPLSLSSPDSRRRWWWHAGTDLYSWLHVTWGQVVGKGGSGPCHQEPGGALGFPAWPGLLFSSLWPKPVQLGAWVSLFKQCP